MPIALNFPSKLGSSYDIIQNWPRQRQSGPQLPQISLVWCNLAVLTFHFNQRNQFSCPLRHSNQLRPLRGRSLLPVRSSSRGLSPTALTSNCRKKKSRQSNFSWLQMVVQTKKTKLRSGLVSHWMKFVGNPIKIYFFLIRMSVNYNIFVSFVIQACSYGRDILK